MKPKTRPKTVTYWDLYNAGLSHNEVKAYMALENNQIFHYYYWDARDAGFNMHEAMIYAKMMDGRK